MQYHLGGVNISGVSCRARSACTRFARPGEPLRPRARTHSFQCHDATTELAVLPVVPEKNDTNQSSVQIARENQNKSINVFASFAERLVYPLVPKDKESFITFLFWHSMALTMSTPLARLWRGRWMGVSSVGWLLNKIGIVVRDDIPFGDSPFVYKTTASLDRTLALHAGCGLLWIIVAFAQMVLVRRYKLVWHRKYGYGVLLVFFMHMAACLNSLFADEAKHHPLSKAFLMSAAFSSIIHMLRSIRDVARKDVAGHEIHSVVAFLYSIEGAGTIRTVSHLQWPLKFILPPVFGGPSDCQAIYNGQAAQCVASYCIRMVFTRVLTYYWIGMYARCSKTRRSFVVSTLFESILTTSIGALFAMLIANFNADTFFDAGQSAAGDSSLLLSCWILISVGMLSRW